MRRSQRQQLKKSAANSETKTSDSKFRSDSGLDNTLVDLRSDSDSGSDDLDSGPGSDDSSLGSDDSGSELNDSDSRLDSDSGENEFSAPNLTCFELRASAHHESELSGPEFKLSEFKFELSDLESVFNELLTVVNRLGGHLKKATGTKKTSETVLANILKEKMPPNITKGIDLNDKKGYLKEDFDINTLSNAELRNILLQYGFNYGGYSRQDLIDIFTMEILPWAPQILDFKIERSSRGIENA